MDKQVGRTRWLVGWVKGSVDKALALASIANGLCRLKTMQLNYSCLLQYPILSLIQKLNDASMKTQEKELELLLAMLKLNPSHRKKLEQEAVDKEKEREKERERQERRNLGESSVKSADVKKSSEKSADLKKKTSTAAATANPETQPVVNTGNSVQMTCIVLLYLFSLFNVWYDAYCR